MDDLTRIFGALADPTRRAILARLIQGEATVRELAEPFSMSMPAVSKHVKVLETAGLLSQRVAKQTRPCRVNADNIKLAADYVEMFRPFWDSRFDQLERYIETMKSTEQNND